MLEELSYSQKFWSTLLGGSAGLLMSAGFVKCHGLLISMGLGNLASISIMLVITIGIIIFASPYIPTVFNNVSFCYFTIALIDSPSAIARLPQYLYSLALGCIILELGCAAILKIYTN